MIPQTLSALAKVVGSRLPVVDQLVSTVVRDSRAAGPGSLFVALRGERTDGHRFVAAALEAGATAALVAEEWAEAQGQDFPGRLLAVPDTLAALGALGRSNRRKSGALAVAITGTVGKTTCKEWLAAALGTRKRVVKAPESYNNAVGVPLTLLLADADTEVIVCEVGTNGPGEIAALGALVEPDFALLTAVGPGHLEGLGDVAGVLAEKASLFSCLRPGGQGFGNGNDRRIRAAASSLGLRLSGNFPGSCQRGRLLARHGTSCTVAVDGAMPFAMELYSPHLLDNLLLVLAVAAELGVPQAQALPAIAAATLPGGRQRVERCGGLRLIDDAYNANPLSMRAALASLGGYPSRRVAVLGDMLELGAASIRLHRELGRAAVEAGVELLVCVGDFAPALAAGARDAGISANALEVVTRAALGKLLALRLRPGDTVLLKASRGLGLERELPALREAFAPVGV